LSWGVEVSIDGSGDRGTRGAVAGSFAAGDEDRDGVVAGAGDLGMKGERWEAVGGGEGGEGGEGNSRL
jgi:hypothetical protein